MAELRAKAEAEDKVTAEQLGLHLDDMTNSYSDFKFAVMGMVRGSLPP